MVASIGGYRSPVDLGLSRVPALTDNPELFAELTDIYNSIHLLASYMDALRLSLSGGGSGQNPAQTMPFNRFFSAIALQDIDAGMPISPSPVTGDNGVIKGALGSNLGGTPYSNFCGIALTSALAGQPIRAGVGPGAIEVPGAAAGSLIWAYNSRATNGNKFNDGGLYLGNPGAKSNATGTAYPMPVAVCVQAGYAVFGQFVVR